VLVTPPSAAEPRATDPVVSLRSASFGYADRAVVSDVSLEIRQGEVIALLGPNGSGKSTLVRGLLGLNDHLAGEVNLFGMPSSQFRDRARLGYVPQRHTLSTSVRATVAEVVAIGRLPHQSWWARPNRRDREIIAASLDLVGLADRAQEDVSTLSGGQQRRVLIARALASQPDVLVMDEPTAGVDTANQEVLSQVLGRLADRGTTMLIVTHELGALGHIVGRILALAGGRVAFDGAPDTITMTGAPETLARGRLALGLLSDGHHHHHDDDPQPEPPRRPATPTSGPFDTRPGGRRG